MRIWCGAMLLAGVLFHVGADEVVFNAENKFGGNWRGTGVTLEDGVLRQKVEKPDSQIYFVNCKIDSTKFNCVEIIYRAEGIPARTSGQIYYALQGGAVDGKTPWLLPSLKNDGEWHVITLRASEKNMRNPDAWLKAKVPVNVIRLDMIDQGPGGVVEVKSVRFYQDSEEK